MKNLQKQLEEIDFDKLYSQEEKNLAEKFTLAEKLGFGFTWFSTMISRYMKDNHLLDEDDLVMEYEIFAGYIMQDDTISIAEIWFEEYFGERWDYEKYYRDKNKQL